MKNNETKHPASSKPLTDTPQHMSIAERNYRLYESLISTGVNVEPVFFESADPNVKWIAYLKVTTAFEFPA